jgi:hypothetical protein
MSLSLSQCINLAAAISGVVGTAFLFNGSFAYEMLTGWTNKKTVDDLRKRNQRRWWYQHIGLGLIFLSFFLQGVAVFVP